LSHFTTNENEEMSRRCFLCDTALSVVGLAALRDETAAKQARPGNQKLMDEMLKTLDDPRITHQRITFQNGADEIQAFLARPKADGRRKTIVVIPGDFGLSDYTRVTVAQLAQQGFVALGLDTFSRASKLTNLQEARRIYFDVMTDALTLQDIQAAIAYLKRQAFVRQSGIGTLGFCLGGRYALLIAALSKDVAATVAFYGPILLLKGEPNVNTARPLKIPNHEMSPLDFVPWIKVPIQGHYAAKDDTIPVADVQRFEQELRRRGAPAEMFIYDTGSHFHSFHEPFYNPEAANLSWERTLKFFKLHLR
jgi:carboxymethylenebutenolidase